MGDGLKYSCFGMLGHQADHANNGLAADKTISVHYNHVFIAQSPASAEIGDISAFAFEIYPAVPVKQMIMRA